MQAWDGGCVQGGQGRELLQLPVAWWLKPRWKSLQLRSLSIYTNADNTASRRVAEKIGAVLAQIKPEDDGRYCAVYELKPEYLQSE